MTLSTDPATLVTAAAPRARRRIGGPLLGLLLGAVSGLLMAAAIPDYLALWPLAFIAIVPAIVAGYRLMPRGFSGVPLGIAWAIYWLAWGLLSIQIAPLWVFFLGAAVYGLFGVVISSFDRRLSELTAYRFFLLQLPVTWTAFDVLWQENLLNGGEGEYSSLVAPAIPLLQPMSIVGQAGLTFVLVMVNCALALVLIGWLDRRPGGGRAIRVPVRSAMEVFTTAAVVSVAWVVVGVLVFAQVQATQGPPVRVAAIQVGPGLGIDPSGLGSDTPQLREALVRMTKDAAAQGAKLAVWGERILSFDPRKDPDRFVQRTARDTGLFLVVGWTEGTGWAASNVVGLWDPDGDLVGIYYKIHPVIMAGEGFEQPVRYPVFDTALGPISMIICFDFSFEAPARQMANGGARLMAAAVEDWSGYAPMRIATVSLRAAENRVPFVKSEVLNASAVVDATGTVLASADMGWEGGQALLVVDVPLGPIDAPYSNLGPLFGYLCVFILAMRILFQVRLEWLARRRRSVPVPQQAD